MAAKSPAPPVDPATDAARLLLRIGLAALALCPIAALVSRRGVVVLAPVGFALIALGTILGSEGREPFRGMARLAPTPAGAAGLFLALWSLASILWTPFPHDAAARWVNVVALSAGATAAALSLPAHLRASNINIFPVGLGTAALAVLVLRARYGLEPALETDRTTLDRIPLLFGILLAPCAAWLFSQGRTIAAGALAVTVTAALSAAGGAVVIASLGIGAAVYGAMLFRPVAGRRIATALTAGLVLFAPLIPFLLRPLAKLVLGTTHPAVDAIRVWTRTVSDDPLRLITGHGFETAMRARDAGLVPAGAPRGLLFEVWFELGLLGALALAFLLARAVKAAAEGAPAAAPGAVMTVVVAMMLAVSGQVGLQSWWVTMLGIAVVVLVAVEHGQHRTERPRTGAPAPRSRPTLGGARESERV
jgi:hypothetical protein